MLSSDETHDIFKTLQDFPFQDSVFASYLAGANFYPPIHGDEDKNYGARVYRLNPGEYWRSASQSTAIFGS